MILFIAYLNDFDLQHSSRTNIHLLNDGFVIVVLPYMTGNYNCTTVWTGTPSRSPNTTYISQAYSQWQYNQPLVKSSGNR